MKFVISRVHLLVALNIVTRAVSSKNPKMILTGIKFELNKNGMFLTGSDSDLSIVTKIPLEENNESVIVIFQPGVVVLSAKYITEIVRKLEGERLEFELVDNNVLKIKDQHSDFSLNCMDSNEYPILDLNANGSIVNLTAEQLRAVIQQTTFAATDKETRPILTGVNFRCDGNLLECVATDSYRLAKKEVHLNETSMFNVTIPAKTLNEILRILESEKTVELCISDKKAMFKFQKTLVSSRVISGNYPETSKLIPSTFEYQLKTLSQNFIAAIDRAALLSVDRSNVVKLTATTDKIEISSRSQEIGSVVESINTFRYQGNPLEISFTARYLMEAIRAIGTEEIVLLFNGDMKPFVVKHEADDSTIQLVLPVRTY